MKWRQGLDRTNCEWRQKLFRACRNGATELATGKDAYVVPTPSRHLDADFSSESGFRSCEKSGVKAAKQRQIPLVRKIPLCRIQGREGSSGSDRRSGSRELPPG